MSHPGSSGGLGPASDIRVVDVRTRKVRRVDTYSGGGLTTIGRGAPSWSGSRLYWARLCQDLGTGHAAYAELTTRARARMAISAEVHAAAGP